MSTRRELTASNFGEIKRVIVDTADYSNIKCLSRGKKLAPVSPIESKEYLFTYFSMLLNYLELLGECIQTGKSLVISSRL